MIDTRFITIIYIFAGRSECKGVCGKVFQAVKVALPPAIKQL